MRDLACVSLLLAFGLLISSCCGEDAKWRRDVQVEDEDSLRFVALIHRHGDRTPAYIPEQFEDQWPLGEGQLTGLGVHQLWLLGQALRGNLSSSFLPDQYSAGVTFSRAANKDRTLQSAEAMLMALFPPGTGPDFPFEASVNDTEPSLPYDFQPVPTHSVEMERDWLLRSFQNCKAYMEYLDDTLFTSAAALEKEAEYSDTIDAISEAFNSNVTLPMFYSYFDYLKCADTHGMQDLVSQEVYDSAEELNSWIWSQEFKPSDQSALIGGALIGQIMDDMQTYATGDNTKLKLKLYSGHDVTLGCLRSILGLESPSPPPYASWALFELHRHDEEWMVRFTYNGDVPELPFCGELHGDYCPLYAYETSLRQFVPADPAEQCSSLQGAHVSDETSTSSQPLVSLSLLLAILSCCVIVLAATTIGLAVYVTMLRRDHYAVVRIGGRVSDEVGQPTEIELQEVKQ